MTPASDGSSWTYDGTMKRTTWEAGRTAYGSPEESVTTIPGSRYSAIMRAASSALESTDTTGNFFDDVFGVHVYLSGSVRPIADQTSRHT